MATRARRSLVTDHMTWPQIACNRRLTEAIRRAVTDGLTVPCLTEPARWDDARTALDATPCDGCPVLDLCTAYADTGAVTHGVLANRPMNKPRRRKSTKATEPRCAAA